MLDNLRLDVVRLLLDKIDEGEEGVDDGVHLEREKESGHPFHKRQGLIEGYEQDHEQSSPPRACCPARGSAHGS